MKIIGHRGARGLGPENTLAAFEAALETGVDEVELDVRVTKDGICVLNHDPFLHDASGGKLRQVRIHEQTLTALREHRPDLVTLDEAIRFVDRRAPMLIEVKPKVDPTPVIASVRTFLEKGWQSSDFLLGSFSQSLLRALHVALPDIEKVINSRFSGIRAHWRARQVNTRRVAFNHHNMWFGFVVAMHKRGFKLTTYTLNDPRKAQRWRRYGLYGVVTDFPDRFKRP